LGAEGARAVWPETLRQKDKAIGNVKQTVVFVPGLFFILYIILRGNF